jgi:hypothetical protein
MLEVITFWWDAEHHDKHIRTAYSQWLLRQHINDIAFFT